MENLRRYESDELQPEAAAKIKKPRWLKLAGEGFLRTWNELRDNSEPAEADEEDEADEAGDASEKPNRFGKRFRKTWHGLFGRLAKTENPSFNPPTYKLNQPNQSEPNLKAVPAPEASPREYQSPYKTARPGFETAGRPNKDAADFLPNPEVPPAPVAGGAGAEQGPPKPPTAGGEGPPIGPSNAAGERLSVNPSQITAEAAFRQIARQEAAAEAAAARRGAVGAALGLDILDPLGRWRENRKDRRTLQAADKKTDQKLRPFERFNQKIANETALNQAKIINLQAEAARFTGGTNQAGAEKTRAAPETPRPLKPEQTINLAAGPESRVEPANPTPEIVFKEVQKAAEKNVPLEALFERRHEIKDQPKETTGIASGGPDLRHAYKDHMAGLDVKFTAPAPPFPTKADLAKIKRTGLSVRGGTAIGLVAAIILMIILLIIS